MARQILYNPKFKEIIKMNIFVLNEDPIKSAQQMVDKHVVKMPVESLQMISTCLHCVKNILFDMVKHIKLKEQ